MKKFENIIIGFGKGGKTLAARWQRLARPYMVERSDKMYGGTCINVACIPTKYLENQAADRKRWAAALEAPGALPQGH